MDKELELQLTKIDAVLSELGQSIMQLNRRISNLENQVYEDKHMLEE